MKVSLDQMDTRIKWSMVKHNLSRNFEPHPPPTLASSSNDIPLVVNVSVQFFINYFVFVEANVIFNYSKKKLPIQSIFPSKCLYILVFVLPSCEL